MAIVGEIAAGLAHEINNPLGGMRNCIKRIKKNPGNQKQILEYAEMMYEALDRIEKVLKQLLDFSIEYQYEFEEADVNQMIQQCLSLFRYNMLSRKITIVKRLDKSLPPVVMDSDSMMQVTLNLILNVVAAMPDGGRLTVKTFMENRSALRSPNLCISIIDSGKGINETIAPKIFDPFFTTKAPNEGTGLGLPISLNIVKDHDGDITFDSAPGRGTTFTVSIPLSRSKITMDKSVAKT